MPAEQQYSCRSNTYRVRRVEAFGSLERSVISGCQVWRQIFWAKKHTKKKKQRKRPEKSEARLIDRKRNRQHKSFIALASFWSGCKLVNYTLTVGNTHWVWKGAVTLKSFGLTLETDLYQCFSSSSWTSNFAQLHQAQVDYSTSRQFTGHCLVRGTLFLAALFECLLKWHSHSKSLPSSKMFTQCCHREAPSYQGARSNLCYSVIQTSIPASVNFGQWTSAKSTFSLSGQWCLQTVSKRISLLFLNSSFIN